MARITPVLFLVIASLNCIVFAQLVFEIQDHFELENAVPENATDFWVWRSEAYNMKTLRLEDTNRTYTIELSLCIDPYVEGNVTAYINDIRYANDGPRDIVYVMISGITIGNFTTSEKWRSGHEWNIFRNSGRVGPSMVFRKGRYTLQIQVETDKWGIEFDRIRMNAENQNPMSDLFCGGRLYRNDI